MINDDEPLTKQAEAAAGAKFAPVVQEFWDAPLGRAAARWDSDAMSVIVDAALDTDRRVTVLETAETTRAVISPGVAHLLDLDSAPVTSRSAFEAALARAGIVLHGADSIFYWSETARALLIDEVSPPQLRVLTADDSTVFGAFQASASEQDLDDAWVELDHWAVVGGFVGDRLVCAASAYPWRDSPFADLGVLTLPDARGNGHARAVVRELSRVAIERGYEPQYRCQLDNTASLALAASAGLSRFANWNVVSPDSQN